ncbi:MAG: DUF2312 domain-containing protein [Mesorhizobium sp.]|uniref:DUF2312 domain-containing protein n=1 Tax=Mesorhizobium sp. TaxID=1871066 RepID=UPI000FE6405A|nr:GapR family DNA-binding domain-containing protein [Mesorhizobium sp.]RWF41612.1 MAG: DUF2312 domain-containing protein [Mesorhizobium sp.]
MIKSRQSSAQGSTTDDVIATAETIAAAQLRSFIDRILRLKEEQDTIGDDIKEVYAEMKGCGFDRTAAGALVTELRRKMKDGDAAFEERNSILDLYRTAYEAGAKRPHTHAPAPARENIEEIPPHDAVTGELLDDQNAPEALVNDEPSPEAGPQTEASLAGTGTGTLADREGRIEGEAASADLPANSNSSDPTSSPEKTDKPEAAAHASGTISQIPDCATTVVADGQPSTPSPEAARARNDGPQNTVISQESAKAKGNSGRAVTLSDEDVPAFLLKDHKPAGPKLNPDCQKPQSCRWSHSQASCAKCANDAAIARQRGRAA